MDKLGSSSALAEQAYSKAARRLIPFLFLCYLVAFLDRVNVGFAKLQMAPELGFSDAIYGFGAGIFFIGYFFLEVPSNIMLERVGARAWIARIMISWGLISCSFTFVDYFRWGFVSSALGYTDSELSFYFLRFLLGVAEAGFFPGIILYLTYWFPGYRRTRMVALFMTALAISNLLGSPISGAIMQFMDGVYGMGGWRWLFLLEGFPSIVVGFLVLSLLPNGPAEARWLTVDERKAVIDEVDRDNANKGVGAKSHSIRTVFGDVRVWAFAFAYLCGVVCFYAINFWMPTIIQELGIANNDFLKVGMISMIPWGVSAIFMVYWAGHSDRTGERRWHVAGALALTVFGLVGLALVGKAVVPSLIALTVIACGILAFAATFWALPTAFLTGSAAAAGIALINSVGNLGGHFGPDLIGRVRTMNGGATDAAFWALAFIAAVGVLIVLIATRSRPDQPS